MQGLPLSETDAERKGLLREGLLSPSRLGLPAKLFIRLSLRATDSPVVVVARLTPSTAFKDDVFILVITESVILSDRRLW
jgi:hypothetical protein